MKAGKKHLALELLQIQKDMTILQKDDGDKEWEDWVVAVAEKLSQAWPMADATLATCLYVSRNLQFIKDTILTWKDEEYEWKRTETKKSVHKDVMRTTNCHWCGMSTEIAYCRKWGTNPHGEENMLHYCMNCREKKPDGCEFGPVHSKEDTQWLVGYVEAAMAAKNSIL